LTVAFSAGLTILYHPYQELKIVEVVAGEEPADFLDLLVPAPSGYTPPAQLPSPTAGNLTKLHVLQLVESGKSLELPQLVAAGRVLSARMLTTGNVYLLDDYTDVYVWFGRKSSLLMRAAAGRVARALLKAMPRPEHAQLTVVKEGVEGIVFKSKFGDWNDLISPDYRSADVQQVRVQKIEMVY
jgi:hypothetical protein